MNLKFEINKIKFNNSRSFIFGLNLNANQICKVECLGYQVSDSFL